MPGEEPLTVAFQGDVRYTVGENFARSASLSPDGRRIVFTGADQTSGTLNGRADTPRAEKANARRIRLSLRGSPRCSAKGFLVGSRLKSSGFHANHS